MLTCYDDNEIEADLFSKLLHWFSVERLKPGHGEFGNNNDLCTDYCKQFAYTPALTEYTIHHIETLFTHAGWGGVGEEAEEEDIEGEEDVWSEVGEEEEESMFVD